jgi:NAD(P)-dependent dehydrogenase (short-subunit alcohol dehydrogenase family)
MIDLSQCSAIVTGGNSGLGRATVEALQQRGAFVVVADVQGDTPCDVTQEADVLRVIQEAQARGPIACVVNCAGILDGQRLVGKEGPHDLARFERVIRVNLIGTFNVMRLAVEAMSKQSPLNAENERGLIITTASVAAFEGQIGQAAYAASKGGVASMTLPAAREFARFGIRVVCIAPGLFETPMMSEIPEKLVQSLQAHVQFPHRLGRGQEYAQLVLSILDNPMLNGCTLRLDGAVRLMPQ